MRAYKVSVTVRGDATDTTYVHWAATQADARDARRAFVNDLGVKMSAVETDEVDIPTAKAELIAFINKLAA